MTSPSFASPWLSKSSTEWRMRARELAASASEPGLALRGRALAGLPLGASLSHPRCGLTAPLRAVAQARGGLDKGGPGG